MNVGFEYSNLPQALERNALENRRLTFIKSGQGEIHVSYAQLLDKSRAMIAELKQRGVKQGDEVVIQTDDNEFFLIVFWACLMYGCPAVPVTVASKADNAKKFFNILAKLSKPHLVTDDKNLNRISQFESGEDQHLVIDVIRFAILKEQIDYAKRDDEVDFSTFPGSSNIAYIQFSSGSTGKPKGVTLTHRNLLANTLDMIERAGLGPTDSIFSWLPLTHDMGLIAVHLMAVVANIDQVIMDTSLFVRRPTQWLQKASEYRSSILFSPNFGYYFLLANLGSNTFDWDLSSIRLIFNGAEPISVKVCQQFVQSLSKYHLGEHVIFAGYGLAEASVAVSLPESGAAMHVCKVERTSLNHGNKIIERSSGLEFVAVGQPLRHCQTRITSEGFVVEECIVGDVEIRGDNVTQGYYRDESESKKLFTIDGWLKTGDVGFIRNGSLYITGRRKNIIIINGQNFYPHDIESICGLAGVELGQVAACSVKLLDGSGEGLAVFVASNSDLNHFVSLSNKISLRLIESIGVQPQYIIQVRRIPKTTSGKIQHFKLASEFDNGNYNEFLEKVEDLKSRVPKSIPDNAYDSIVDLCGNVFGYHFDPKLDFLNQGINSLQIIRFTMSLQRLFGVSLLPIDLFTYPSIDKLSDKVRSLLAEPKGQVEIEEHSDLVLPASRKRLWLWDQIHPKRTALILSSAQILNGPLKVSALCAAFEAVIARHHSLRSVFVPGKHGPEERIMRYYDVNELISVEDFTGKTIDVEEIVDSKLRIRFNLEKGPLLRVHIIKIGSRRHIVIMLIHHLIFDGWSFGNLLNEVARYYRHFANPEKISLQLPEIPYDDYKRWRYEQMRSSQREIAKSYWIQNLKDMPKPITAAFMKEPLTRREVITHSSCRQEITSSQLKRIRELARQHGTSVFMFLLASLKVLFHKYTKQKDIALFVSTFGRNVGSVENLIGYFVQTVMVRTEVAGHEPFRDYLLCVKERLVNAFQHFAFSLEEALEIQRHEMDDKHSDIFDVLVLYQNFEYDFRMHPIDAEIQIESIQRKGSDSLVNLELEFTELEDRVKLTVTYDNGLFDDFVVNALLHHYLNLLDEIVLDVEKKLDDLSIQKPEDKKRLFEFSNVRTHVDPPRQSVVELFQRQVILAPDRPAIYWDDRLFTYNEVELLSNHLATYLTQHAGVNVNDKVGVFLRRGERQIISIIGVMKAGAAYVPLDCDYPADRINTIIVDCCPKAIVSDLISISGSSLDDHQVVLWEHVLSAKAYAGQGASPRNSPEGLAYVMYTSGTTGKPKGVAIRNSSLSSYVKDFIDYFKLTSDDIVVQQSSICFDTYNEEVFPILCIGGAIVGISEGARNTAQLCENIKLFKATILSSTPAVLMEVNHFSEYLDSLRLVISGGEPLNLESVQNLLQLTEVYNTYGPTECTVCAAFHRVRSNSEYNIIGRPINSASVLLLNGSELAPIGFQGEVYIGGSGLALGYLNDPESTLEKFIANPVGLIGNFYRTGDLARWNSEGLLEYIGRNDAQVKIRGHRVEPAEVERTLLQSAFVENGVVVSQQNRSGKMMLTAYLVPKQGVDMETVKSELRGKVPNYMVPSRWVELQTLPLTINGKVDRKKLIREYPLKGDVEIVPPSNPLEERMFNIWSEVLNAPISVDESLFSYGGDSMSVIKIVSKCREHGIQIFPADVFHFESVAALCNAIKSNGLTKESLIDSQNTSATEVDTHQESSDDFDCEDIIKI